MAADLPPSQDTSTLHTPDAAALMPYVPALLRAAATVGGKLEHAELVAALRDSLADLPDVLHVGIAVYDAPRTLLSTYATRVRGSNGGTPPTVESWDEELVPERLVGLEAVVDLRLNDAPRGDRTLLERHVLGHGAQRLVGVPLRLQERRLGALFVTFRKPAAPPRGLVPYLTALARIAVPVLWNCHTEARFRHGDRRRDTLIELSNAINTSLELTTVLDSARQAIRQLDGHCFSSIDVLEPDGAQYRRYPAYATKPVEPARSLDPTPQPLTDSVLAWVLEHPQTYQSDDLAQRHAFPADAALIKLGVRRYIAAPMFVRGRIIGCFLMGSVEAHRALSIDVWLYENIALQLALAIDNARQLAQVQQLSERLTQQNVYLREEIQSEHDFGEMIGQSPAMQQVRAAISRVARTDASVLISGETGVGKELVARAIHGLSTRAALPMVKVNCAAIPEGMVESELFGHERGAFTSAVERRIGRFELAHDGTLFLDEVGELSPAVQAKLLRVLQDGEFERVGGTRTLRCNVRIIAATNRDLAAWVDEGRFRRDLYFRLNVFPIQVAPLRERRADIPLLANAFVAQLARRMGKRIEQIDPAALAELEQRPWPGNIRELRHVIERALILSDGPMLRIDGQPEAPPPPAGPSARRTDQPVALLKDAEAAHIRRALEQTRWTIEGPRGAAAMLGLKPSTLRFRMKRLGIHRNVP